MHSGRMSQCYINITRNTFIAKTSLYWTSSENKGKQAKREKYDFKKKRNENKKKYNKERKTAMPIVEPGPPAGKVGS